MTTPVLSVPRRACQSSVTSPNVSGSAFGDEAGGRPGAQREALGDVERGLVVGRARRSSLAHRRVRRDVEQRRGRVRERQDARADREHDARRVGAAVLDPVAARPRRAGDADDRVLGRVLRAEDHPDQRRPAGRHELPGRLVEVDELEADPELVGRAHDRVRERGGGLGRRVGGRSQRSTP